MHSVHSFFRENKDGREQWGEQKVRDYYSNKHREPNRNKWRNTKNRDSQKQRNRESPPPAAGSRDALDNLRALKNKDATHRGGSTEERRVRFVCALAEGAVRVLELI